MAWVAVIVAWSAVAAWLQNPWITSVLSAALTLQTIRRLHDLGRTGWWAAAIFLGQVILSALPGTYRDSVWTYWVATLFPWTCLLVIAILPGQRLENRFGPPPGTKSMASPDQASRNPAHPSH